MRNHPPQTHDRLEPVLTHLERKKPLVGHPKRRREEYEQG